MTIFAIIPAAGLGKRFGAQKQFLELAGKPILIHTLLAFEHSPAIDGVCVVVPKAEIENVRGMVAKYDLKKISLIVAGGKERQDSVRLGFQSLSPCDFVIVHDGVRPLITPDLIQKVLSAAETYEAAIAALPVKETIKRADAKGSVKITIDRDRLWSIQTPQAFRHKIFKKAVEKSLKDGFLGTDESSLVERLGKKVKMVEGDPYNIKVTRPEDLKLAEIYLGLRKSCASD